MLQAIVGNHDLSRADIAIAATLLDMLNADGIAWPKISTLAERTGQSARNAIRCIDRLTTAGYFTVTEGKGRGNAHTYRPKLESVPKADTAVTFSNTEKVTAKSVKGDTGVQEKVTPASVHIRRTSFKNQLEEPERDQRDAIALSFEEFWRAYPAQRRYGKPQALGLYTQVLKRGAATVDDLLSAATRYAASRNVADGYACNPCRWLREERWNLDFEQPRGSNTDEQRNPRRKPSPHETMLAAGAGLLAARCDPVDSGLHDGER